MDLGQHRVWLICYFIVVAFRASPGVLSMRLCKKNSDIQVQFFFFFFFLIFFILIPSIKLKLWLAKGERLLIANHMGQSLGLTNQKHGASVKSASHCLTRLIKLWNNAGPKLNVLSQTSTFSTFLHLIFKVQRSHKEGMLLHIHQFIHLMHLEACSHML
jgi:hypothetical protein